MDIHKPKPVHSWREFLSEILVVVHPETLDRRLTAIQKLRCDENGRVAISDAMLAYRREHLSATPSNPAAIASNAAQAKDCEARLLAIQTDAKP